jgi:uncharacterized oxidoreductase
VQIRNNIILITGGATGIGFALAESFVNLGNTVIICGRRKQKLDEAERKLPGIHTKKCDISDDNDLKSLYSWIEANFKGLNVVVNNAGVQRQIDFKKGRIDLLKKDGEIDINFRAPICIVSYFIPLLLKNPGSAIINISSGLGFVPLAIFPIYSATKAAIHSFSISLRHQLKESSIKVFEVVPPIVHDTELKGRALEKSEFSVSASEVSYAIMKGLENDQYEIAIGATKDWVAASRGDLDNAFLNMNR